MTTTRRAMLALLALGGGLAATAQTPEVPGVVNTYRLSPASAAAYSNGTVNLSQREVEELYYESFIAGAMQGRLDNAGRLGLDAAGRAYPALARDFSPADRMPRMPLQRNPGPDGVYGPGPGPDSQQGTSDDLPSDDELILTVRIEKLPTRATSQRVVAHLTALGLLPGANINPVNQRPQATGRWRLIIHPPRSKAAPPAPSLYYPEAVSAIRPDTAAADITGTPVDPPGWSEAAIQRYWTGLVCRWRDWQSWVDEVYTNAANPVVHTDANAAWGQEAEPVFLTYPRYLTLRPISRAANAERIEFQPTAAGVGSGLADVHGRFFNERTLWENALLDPDAEAEDPTAGSPATRLPDAQPYSDGPQNAPLQYLINVDSAGAPAPWNTAQPAGWTLPGVHTSGPAESHGAGVPVEYAAEQDTVVHTVDHSGAPTVGPGGAFYNLSGQPIEVTINLLTGQWWDGAAWRGQRRDQPLTPGLGMVELQFEYGTPVPGADGNLRRDWLNDWFGPDDQYNTGDDEWQTQGLDNPRGADGTGGNADDRAPYTPSYFVGLNRDPRVAGALLLRDPLADPASPAGAAPRWDIRRFSGWPFHPAFVGLATADPNTDYRGGPIVCRFVVSAVGVVPEDQLTTSPTPDLGQLASYDPGNNRFYPQLDLLPGADLLERPVFLLGFRADDTGGGLTRTEDYFFPIRHGSRSASHRVFVRTVLDHLAGGVSHVFTPVGATPLVSNQIHRFGYPLRGAADPRGHRGLLPIGTPATGAAVGIAVGPPVVPYYHPISGFRFSRANAGNQFPDAPLAMLLHRRALRSDYLAYQYQYAGTGTDPETNVNYADAGRFRSRAAFDGDQKPPRLVGDDVVLPPGYSVGLYLSPPSYIDRIEVWWNQTPAPATAPFEIEFYQPTAAPFGGPGLERWDTRPRAVPSAPLAIDNDPQGAGGHNAGTEDQQFCWSPGPAVEDLYGVRIRNTSATNLRIDEIRVLTKGDLRRAVTQAPVSPRQGSDPDIPPTPISGSAVEFQAPANRQFTVDGDSVATTELRVDVPRFQPPSTDSVERTMLSDRGLAPATYQTRAQPTPTDPTQPRDWDRYRGQVAVFVDETRSRSWAFDDRKDPNSNSAPSAGATYDKSQWDVDLYRLRYRGAGEINVGGYNSPAMLPTYQFVSWYEEDSGWVGAACHDPAQPANGFPDEYRGRSAARLEDLERRRQQVAVETYSTFDLEFSVGFERKLAIAEALLDLGKVIHGGITSWVPATLVNEGNVPLRRVRLYVERPLTPIDLEDGTTVARLSQMQPVPSWFFDNLALGAPAEDGSLGFVDASGAALLTQLDPAPVGAPAGRQVTDLYLRVGRLNVGRQVPVGQPMGNYSGIVRAFVDNLGDPGADVAGDNNDLPDNQAEIGLGGASTLKLTVTESPWARIAGFWDNEVDRNLDVPGNPPVATLPYDPFSGLGTYQPVPAFAPYYTNPDLNEATPAIAVVQDPDEMDDDPPNASDQLWIATSRYEPLGGGANWSVYYRDGGRPVLPSGVTLQTGYRSFLWPDLAAVRLSAGQATERNLYPNVCRVPELTGANQQHVMLWHNEREENGRRASYLQFQRYQGGTASGLLEFADDAGGQGLLAKQVPRAFVDNVDGTPILWCTWQSGEGGGTFFGFNAVAMPGNAGAPGTAYTDAIGSGGNQFVNYRLRTPPGLVNLMEPWVQPSYRHEQTNATAGNDLQAVNLFYSAWSPLWENQDIYWSRYRAMEDPDDLTSLRESPMAEDAFRLRAVPTHPWGPNEGYVVLTQPGGRVPFPRQVNELLRTNAEHTVYAAWGGDWLMPPERPRVSYLQGPQRRIDAWNHRGFADTNRPLFDNSRFDLLPAAGAPDPALDPLVVLRVYENPVIGGGPSTDPVNEAQLIGFQLNESYWDPTAEEWVLPVDGNSPGGALLIGRGVTVARIHPGLGRVTFNRALERAGVQRPLFIYATYRPCAWRLTSDRAVDSQPTAAFDPWERLTISWRRTDEGGRGQLWYRTFSLAVPLSRAPVLRVRAVVDDTDADDDQRFNGSQGGVANWYFVARDGGDSNDADGAFSDLNLSPTAQGFDLVQHDNSVLNPPAQTAQGNAQIGWNAAGMVHFGFEDAGRRVRCWYEYQYTDGAGALAQATSEEAFVVPGLGPERLVPVDGLGSESQPAIAAESFYAGYPLGGQPQPEPILASRMWLAWVSSRDLYVEGAAGASPPRLGQAAGNVYYGTFLPDYSPSTVRR